MTEPQDKGELEYGSILPSGEDWRLRKFDAGMGENEYRIFRNEKFFAMFDNRQDADSVMVAMTCSAKSSGAVLDDVDIIASHLSVNKQLITFVKKVTNTLRRRELRQQERDQ